MKHSALSVKAEVENQFWTYRYWRTKILKNGGKLISIESEKKEGNVANHHYNEEIAKELPFSNGIDLEKFKKIANECNLTFKIETLECEKINLMIVCEKVWYFNLY